MSESVERRIACVQFDSKHADVPRNTETVLNLVAGLISERASKPIHLLVLPELALTGYVFKGREEIDPLLEDVRSFKPPSSLADSLTAPSSSTSASTLAFVTACMDSCKSSSHPSLTLASHLAQLLRCHVVIGFPERGSHGHTEGSTKAKGIVGSAFDARPQDTRSESTVKGQAFSVDVAKDTAFNSAALLSPDGSLLHVFRKHFLYETDEVWATEGQGFEALHLPNLGNVCVAICMDLNPFRFQTPFETCELASFCVQRNVDLLVVPMAWLLPKDEHEKQQTHQEKSAPSLSTINYWAVRCLPFFDLQRPSSSPSKSATASTDPVAGATTENKTRYLVTTNRTGTEATSTFAGSSCVLQIKPGERPVLLDCLGSSEQACLVATLPP